MTSYTPLVPPLKCQGIKTKLAELRFDAWLCQSRVRSLGRRPFCGSAVVAFNVQPKKADVRFECSHHSVLSRSQASHLTPGTVRAFLFEHGEELRRCGEDYYYTARDRFNQSPDSLTFYF